MFLVPNFWSLIYIHMQISLYRDYSHLSATFLYFHIIFIAALKLYFIFFYKVIIKSTNELVSV